MFKKPLTSNHQTIEAGHKKRDPSVLVPIALFILFDCIALSLNYFISYQLADSAVAINLAGRQRMLSQRMTKALLSLQWEGSRQWEASQYRADALSELQDTLTLFDSTLNGFWNGGKTLDGGGHEIWLPPVTTEPARLDLSAALRIWTQTKEKLSPFSQTANRPASAGEIEAAVASLLQNNLKLEQLMNAVTLTIENDATRKTGYLRFLQTLVLILALINFFIVYNRLLRIIRQSQQNNAALKASESALKEAGSLAGLGAWQWDTRTGVHSWSEELYRIFGRDPVLPPVTYPEVQQYFTPDSWAPLAAAVEKGLAEGAPYECDAEVVRPDGTHRWIVARGEAMRDATGNIISLHGMVQDITERKRQEHRFRQALESAPNAIVMVNEPGTILMINLQTERSFGYSRHELIGQSVEKLVPERFRGGHTAFRQAYFAAPQSRPMGAGRDLYGLRKDGSEFPVEIGLGLIDDENGIIVLSSIVDITERKNANDKLKQALNEKEMLLKEVYHRVKNNLQVVSSLINLQTRNVKNEETVDLLKQSADRIKAMALLHEKLYQSKDLARIDFNAYIHSLVDHLLFGYGDHSGKVKINMKVDDVFLDVDTAIPCGLIINELLSNALKHAFPDDQHGEIGITFRQDQGEFILVITDNGIGFPADVDFKKSASLGLQLVATLANQLMGRMTLNQTDGTAFTIRFTNIS